MLVYRRVFLVELTNKGCEFDQPIGLWLRVMSAERADIMHGEEKTQLDKGLYLFCVFLLDKRTCAQFSFCCSINQQGGMEQLAWNKWQGNFPLCNQLLSSQSVTQIR